MNIRLNSSTADLPSVALHPDKAVSNQTTA